MSVFQTKSLPVDARLTLVAGRGRYPHLLRQRIEENNHTAALVVLDKETDADLPGLFDPARVRSVKVGQIGKLVKCLRELQTTHAILIGQVNPGKLFSGLHPDWRALQLLMSLKERNAHTIFGAIVNEIESAGIEILDARSFLEKDLASTGVMVSSRHPAKAEYVEHGIRIAREVAALDIGQGVVVRKGTVLAVEAYEGTNAMLARAGSFKTGQKIFVKVAKPGHDFRFDVPVFGLRTLEVMREAGVGTVALEAGRTLLLEREEVLRQASKFGIEMLGFS